MIRCELKYESTTEGRKEFLEIVEQLMPFLSSTGIEKITEAVENAEGCDKNIYTPILNYTPQNATMLNQSKP